MSKYSKAVKKGKLVKAKLPTKGKPQALNTRAIPRTAQRKRIKLTRAEWQKLFGESQRFPLSVRLAAELYRSGVYASEFSRVMHYEDDQMSRNVLEELGNMDAGRGVEPETVPPVLPVLIEYQKSERASGRPSSKDAIEEFKRFADGLRKLGWAEADLRKGAEPFVVEKAVKAVAIEIDEELSRPIKVVKPAYPAGHTGCCPVCDLALKGMSIRILEDTVFTDYHYQCYLLKIAKPVDLTHGQAVLNPADAKTYVWDSTKPAWKAVEGKVEDQS